MHSPGGEATDRIYLQVDDPKTSVSNWRVTVPLWNKTVSVPAEPGLFPGTFYFPPYKNERALVALHFDHAALHRFLDWGEGVRMPQDSQGDQLLFGKNGTNQTAMTHDYQDAKPVWNLGRVNSNDTEIVRISEGRLLIQTKEEPGGAATTPTYDVTPQVETAKGTSPRAWTARWARRRRPTRRPWRRRTPRSTRPPRRRARRSPRRRRR